VGKIAVGKSWVENKLKEKGYPCIDCDKVIKELYAQDELIITCAWNFEKEHIVAKEYFILTKNFIMENIYPYKDKWEIFLNLVYYRLKVRLKRYIAHNVRSKYIFISGYNLSEIDLKFDLILNIKCNSIKNIYRLWKRDKSFFKIKLWFKQTFIKQEYIVPIKNIKSNISIEELLKCLK
jgi:dephospho-CoA kinase